MISETVSIANKLGLHARAASVFVKKANTFKAKVVVSSSKRQADGKNIMSMMLLEAAYGKDLTITIEGPDEDLAMRALKELINDRFGEAE